jgi:outer membrane protein assembly factor BamB
VFLSERNVRIYILLGFAGTVLAGCDHGTTSPDQKEAEALRRWITPTALSPSASLVNDPAATDSIYFLGGAVEISARRVTDGALLWKRADVPSRPPLTVDDSLVVILSAGESAGLRQRDGQVVWRTRLAGTQSSVPPVRSGRTGIFVDFEGTVYTADVYTGAIRPLATMQSLTGGAGQVWQLATIGDTAVIVSQRMESTMIRGAIWLSRFYLPTRSLISTKALPTAAGEMAEANPAIVVDGVLIDTYSAGIGAIVVETGERIWTVPRANIGSRLAVRDGKVYAGTGDGFILVYDVRTGALLRKTAQLSNGISDVYPCREGIMFTSGGVLVVADVTGAVSRIVQAPGRDELYGYFARNSTTLFGNSYLSDVAIRCN